MNEAEHASTLRDLQRRNQKLWEIHQREFEQELLKGWTPFRRDWTSLKKSMNQSKRGVFQNPEQTPESVLAAYERVKPKAQLGEAQHEVHEQKRKISSIKKTPSLLRRAIALELTINPAAKGLDICRALDKDDTYGFDFLTAKYQKEKGSGTLHTTITQVRRKLEGKRPHT